MEFINAFMQQLVVFIVFCIVAGVGVTIGIFAQKKKTAKEEMLQSQEINES